MASQHVKSQRKVSKSAACLLADAAGQLCFESSVHVAARGLKIARTLDAGHSASHRNNRQSVFSLHYPPSKKNHFSWNGLHAERDHLIS